MSRIPEKPFRGSFLQLETLGRIYYMSTHSDHMREEFSTAALRCLEAQKGEYYFKATCLAVACGPFLKPPSALFKNTTRAPFIQPSPTRLPLLPLVYRLSVPRHVARLIMFSRSVQARTTPVFYPTRGHILCSSVGGGDPTALS